MNDAVKRLAYIATSAKARYARDHDALILAGFSRAEIWPDRDLSQMLDPNYPLHLSPGDVVVVAEHDSIGATVRKRNALLTRLARFGVRLEVLGGEPVLYDTDEKLAEFNVTAKRLARAELTRSTKPARGRGRPSPYPISEADKRYICRMWANNEFEREDIRAQAKELVGKDVPDHVINRWCGPRSKPKDLK